MSKRWHDCANEELYDPHHHITLIQYLLNLPFPPVYLNTYRRERPARAQPGEPVFGREKDEAAQPVERGKVTEHTGDLHKIDYR